ncbi:Kunitz/Bovine pancreatic trypsin inhibitor domain protein [Ancylostoma duodenale]|uniref:Kunitz/Bovine pancreatic trypsin inhibitor domain protein n=1 Tax=Ancylostoma duodenale TaxID=51022 RepID=A0A0C2FW63_9BILA|nr:Kunitz/Bovine pancreatic trypsin inhibitor domain protein [Ancylostoma duodenale]
MKFLVFFVLCLIIAIETKYSQRKSPIANCKEPIFPGRCKAGHRRFGYNSATGKCQEFRWGGCDANGNNFRTMGKCREMCESGQQRVQYPLMQQQQVKVPPMPQKNVKQPWI